MDRNESLSAAPLRQDASVEGPGKAFLLLWLCGIALRATVLAVPPVIPLLHADLHLSETDVGVLGSLPPLLFALAAVPGSLLIAKAGARTALLTGLLLTAIGGALRAAAPDLLMLDLMTVVMTAGVAIMQPSLPPLVRQWTPRTVGFSTALYTNGLLVGEILAVSLTIPIVLPLLGGSWRLAFVFWSLPVLLTALLVRPLAPRAPAASPHAPRTPKRWSPDWRSGLTWRLGFMAAGINTIYFGSNAFLPDYLTAAGRTDLIAIALPALNIGQLPASFLMLAFADRLALRAWPYIALGAGAILCAIGMVLLPTPWVTLFAALLGFIAASGLILTLALPPLLSAHGDEHRIAAGMFTISYGCAVVLSVLGGMIWDATGQPMVALIPVAISGVALIFLAATTDLHRHRHIQA
jgi:CP family cyanate transporter-like MFS transporter